MARTQKNKATEYHLGLLKAKLASYYCFIERIWTNKFYISFAMSSANKSLNGIWCLSPPKMIKNLSSCTTHECPSLGLGSLPSILPLLISGTWWISWSPLTGLLPFFESLFMEMIIVIKSLANCFYQKWIFHWQRCWRGKQCLFVNLLLSFSLLINIFFKFRNR